MLGLLVGFTVIGTRRQHKLDASLVAFVLILFGVAYAIHKYQLL